MPSTIRDLLSQVVDLWKKQIELCRKDKAEKFQKTADRLWDFYGKRYRKITAQFDEELSAGFPHAKPLTYRPCINKSKQFVDLFLPYVHSTLTHRLVRPRRPELPPELLQLPQLGLQNPMLPEKWRFYEGQLTLKQAEQLQSWLAEWWLNYVPTEYDSFGEQRVALIDTLVKGRGVVWHELIDGPTGELPASFHIPVDHLLIDADARKFRDAGFIIRERWEPAYRLAEEWKIDVDLLRGEAKSHWAHAQEDTEQVSEEDRKGDLCRVYEIYSRIGVGHRLLTASDDPDLATLGEALEEFGPHVRLLIVPHLNHPLNLKPDDVEAYEGSGSMVTFLRDQLAWPIPFFKEYSNPWPCSLCDPYPNPNDAWATSPLEAGLPIQEELDKTYYWIMQRIRRSCRNLLVLSKAFEKQVGDAIESGMDLEMLFVNEQNVKMAIEQYYSVIQFPDIKPEIWRNIDYMGREYEKATGMTPLMHGMQDAATGKDRSATESEIREQHTSSRPDDIAKAVQDWQSRISSKEGQASRLAVDVATVAPMFGEPGPPVDQDGVANYEAWGQAGAMGPLTMAWLTLVQTDDPAEAAAEMHYTVEAGSGRRKNKQWLQAASNALLPLVLPVAQQEKMAGNPRKWNALISMVGEGWEAPVEKLLDPEAPDEQAAMQAQMMQQAMAAQGAMPGEPPPTDEGVTNAQ
jgi:hypothetical protein